MSIRQSILVLSLALPAMSAFALDSTYVTDIEKSIQLNDGSIVHQFKDGRMAMESKFGRAESMQDGAAMTATDGQLITMKGNEVARLSYYITLATL